MQKPDIRDIPVTELEKYLQQRQEHTFRAKQIQEWLWKKAASSFEEMTNLPVSLRQSLADSFDIRRILIEAEQKSADETTKVRFRLFDGNRVEGVLIPAKKRVTACVSSQCGCSLDCRFCATGQMKLARNLSAGEIFQQVVLLNQKAEVRYGRPITNIVFMGMGEPLLNYRNVLSAINRISSPEGLHFSARRITVSTAGIAKLIRKLADDQVRFELALSLHAANDAVRSKIMPINDSNPIDQLMDALDYFYRLTGNKITFEYILFDGINDSPEDARQLVDLCRRVPAMVNIIEYNPVQGLPFRQSPLKKREAFVRILESRGITAKVRLSRGKDIDAACGQLANK
ncbi:MAG: putative dual-specificity RNA methyltransferase RlmN [Chitinophagales bacterium]|nr:MAG: putative dual-specificity RNA methyltransferase RlmN [Chitinophagales bacterium]